MSADSIIFLGKYNKHLHKIEEDIINLQDRSKKTIENTELPDVQKFTIDGYDCDVWVIIGDVKPTLLLKNLISKCTIIFFCFDLLEPNTLNFLKEGWEPIVKSAKPHFPENNEKQQRFLINTNSPNNNNEDYNFDKNFHEEIISIKEELGCMEFINYIEKKNYIHEYLQAKLIIKAQSNSIPNYNNEINKNEYDNSNNFQNDDIQKLNENDNINYRAKDEEREKLEVDKDKGYEKEELEDETYDIEFNANSKNIEFVDKYYISYILYEKKQIAIIVDSPNAKDDICIPAYIEYNSSKYKIISIKSKAFFKAQINSLSFAPNSEVNKIGDSAFENSTIKELHIPQSLKELRESWCFEANYLNKIDVDEKNEYFSIKNDFLIYKDNYIQKVCFAPRNFKGEYLVSEGITNIGCYSFANLNELTSIKSKTSTLKIIEPYSFFNCQGLKSLNIDQNNNNLVIGKSCFKNSKNLSFVEISCKELTILDYCFFNCQSLVSFDIKKAEKITIRKNAFKGCISLENFMLSKVPSITIDNCFHMSKNLKSIGLIADFISLSDHFVDKCNSLTYINIQCKSDIAIYTSTFKDCNLTNVTIHSNNLKLADKCFANMQNLQYIDIKCNSFDTKQNSINNCYSLISFKIQCEEAITFFDEHFLGCDSLNILELQVNSMLVITTDFLNSKKNLNEVILNSNYIKIEDSCFINCESLKTFSIKQSGTIEFGKNQFTNCINLQEISIESKKASEVTFDENCFSGASNMKEFSLQGGIVKIYTKCFTNCDSLTDLRITKADEITIGPNQFLNSKSLENVNIDSLSSAKLCENSFSGCSKLYNFSIMANDVTIENNCFSNCTSLTYFILSNEIQNLTLKSRIFYKCQKLNQIDFKVKNDLIASNYCFSESYINDISFDANSIEVGEFCFENCKFISEFKVTSKTKVKLNKSAFKNCKKLEKVEIISTNSVTIHEQCFYGDSNLKILKIESKKLSTAEESFFECSSLQSLNLQNYNTINLNKSSFEKCSKLKTVDIMSSFFQAEVKCFSNGSSLESFIIDSTNNNNNNDQNNNKNKKNNKNSNQVTICTSCFENCSKMISFTIKSAKNTLLKDKTFKNCSRLEEVNIESVNLNVYNFCFHKAEKLLTVIFNSKKIIIGGYCFKECNSLCQINCITADHIEAFQSSFDVPSVKDCLDFILHRDGAVVNITRNTPEKADNDDIDNDNENRKNCCIF